MRRRAGNTRIRTEKTWMELLSTTEERELNPQLYYYSIANRFASRVARPPGAGTATGLRLATRHGARAGGLNRTWPEKPTSPSRTPWRTPNEYSRVHTNGVTPPRTSLAPPPSPR